MPVRATPQSATDKWVQHLGSATQAITDGVNRVQKSPGASAAAMSQKWLAKVTASQQKWQAAVGRLSLQQWQAATIAGVPRVAQGAQQKQGKYEAFAAQFFPYLQTGVAKVDAMPNNTLADGIARATAMITHNAGFKRTG